MQNQECATSHDCEDILSRIYLALDDALNEEQQQALMDEVNRCSYCLEQFNIEKAFKEFLCKKIHQKEIPNGMVENIRDKIKQLTVN